MSYRELFLPRRAARLVPLFLLVFLASLVPAGAGQNRWTPIGPYGGSAEGLVISPSDPRMLFVVSSRRELYKSVDGGDSWRSITRRVTTTDGVTAAAFQPQDSSRVYAIVGRGGVYGSTDGGTSWSLLGQGPAEAHTLLVDPSDPSRLYALTTKTVSQSTDGGHTWHAGTSLPGPPWMESVAMVAGSPGVLYAGAFDSEGVVYKSIDGGETWSPKGQSLPRYSAHYAVWVVSDPAHPGTLYAAIDDGYPAVYKSTDGGESWARTGPGGYPVAAGASGSVYTRGARSLDGGATWTATAPPYLYGQHLPLVADPVTPGRVYAVARVWGISRSLDGGNSWQLANQGISEDGVGDFAFDPADPSVLYASGLGYGRLWKKQGAAPWERLASWPAGAEGLDFADFFALAVDATPRSMRFPATVLLSFGARTAELPGSGWRHRPDAGLPLPWQSTPPGHGPSSPVPALSPGSAPACAAPMPVRPGSAYPPAPSGGFSSTRDGRIGCTRSSRIPCEARTGASPGSGWTPACPGEPGLSISPSTRSSQTRCTWPQTTGSSRARAAAPGNGRARGCRRERPAAWPSTPAHRFACLRCPTVAFSTRSTRARMPAFPGSR
jgi:photosystem II stability/assembly factor-like uncharacterized protein